MDVCAEINKTMYGLPQRGKFPKTSSSSAPSSARLHSKPDVLPLRACHEKDPVLLVVDDFGIKYFHKSDAEHLIAYPRDLQN
jgi:hypothetical protein